MGTNMYAAGSNVNANFQSWVSEPPLNPNPALATKFAPYNTLWARFSSSVTTSVTVRA
jgi:hypothetical protein